MHAVGKTHIYIYICIYTLIQGWLQQMLLTDQETTREILHLELWCEWSVTFYTLQLYEYIFGWMSSTSAVVSSGTTSGIKTYPALRNVPLLLWENNHWAEITRWSFRHKVPCNFEQVISLFCAIVYSSLSEYKGPIISPTLGISDSLMCG